MSYGSNVGADGKPISADENRLTPIVGILDNVKIKDTFEISEDGGTASITFIQENGAEVTHKEWSSDDPSNIEETNKRVKHICTKIVSEQEYTTAVSGATGFGDFFNRVSNLLRGKTNGLFRMLFHYNKKGYVTVPRFPNFIESMDVKVSKITMNKYAQKMQTRPDAPTSDLDSDLDTSAGVTNDLPFAPMN